MDGHPAGIECCGQRFDHGSEPPAGRHVKAPRSRAMLLHRGFEGPRPRADLVDARGFSGPGERECEVAIRSLRALREDAVDLETAWTTVGWGSGGTPSTDRTRASMRP